MGLVALTLAAPLAAQDIDPPVRLGVEAVSDLRRRGLGWSDGAPALSATATADVAGLVRLDARTATGACRAG